MELYINKNQKSLRCGYTTGTCAAAAAKAAARLFFSKTAPAVVKLKTPAGVELELDVLEPLLGDGFASCTVRKDSGDDPDVTDGVLVSAKVSRSKGDKVTVDGGEGVGRVTRPGLSCPVGSAAVNPVPRAMIEEAVAEVCREYGETCGMDAVISIPGGAALAKKTYNPRLGIEGGLSILGTSGIVEPMSERALLDSIELELKMAASEGRRYVLVSPGNYGGDFSREILGLNTEKSVKCSNYIGETVDFAAQFGFRGLLLVGHAGKLVKLAAGVMNTHSRVADCRMETLAAHAALLGADPQTIRSIMDCITVDEAFGILEKAGLLRAAMDSVMEKIGVHLRLRAKEMETAAVMFSNQYGILGKTGDTEKLMAYCREGN